MLPIFLTCSKSRWQCFPSVFYSPKKKNIVFPFNFSQLAIKMEGLFPLLSHNKLKQCLLNLKNKFTLPKKVGFCFPQVFLHSPKSWKQHFFLIAQNCSFCFFIISPESFCYLPQTNCKCNYHAIMTTTAPYILQHITAGKIGKLYFIG